MSRHIAGDEPRMTPAELIVRLERARADTEALLIASGRVLEWAEKNFALGSTVEPLFSLRRAVERVSPSVPR